VQLQQIIINLLVNARDAIDGPGRITGHPRARQPVRALRRLRRAPRRRARRAVGQRHRARHPDDVRERMFEMYFTTREPGKGTGIGLWLINNLIHDYHGHVTVASAG
jgi:signal transduction histidine kinase